MKKTLITFILLSAYIGVNAQTVDTSKYQENITDSPIFVAVQQPQPFLAVSINGLIMLKRILDTQKKTKLTDVKVKYM